MRGTRARDGYFCEIIEIAHNSEGDGGRSSGEGGRAGGFVAVDRSGALELPFNTAGMYRGYVREGEPIRTAIYDEPYQIGS